jgi:hypothetical protein
MPLERKIAIVHSKSVLDWERSVILKMSARLKLGMHRKLILTNVPKHCMTTVRQHKDWWNIAQQISNFKNKK